MRQHMYVFVTNLFQIWKSAGNAFFIDYLKVCMYAVNTYIGGNPLKHNTQKVNVKLSNGLPTVIPEVFRREIRAHNANIIHIINSIFYSYKALGLEDYKVDISTITAEAVCLQDNSAYHDFCLFVPRWINHFTKDIKDISEHSCYEIPGLSAGPSGNPSCLYKKSDYYQIRRGHPEIFESLRTFAKEIKHTKFLDIFDSAAFTNYYNKVVHAEGKFEFFTRGFVIGRLCTKYEAAGKVRVFAIGDYWSQWALKPLHDYMFSILRRIKSDATFDQDGVLDNFVSKNIGNQFWSFDLKSATDMIPKDLYIPVITAMVGDSASKAWFKILNRPYRLPNEIWKEESDYTKEQVRYSRGQPMGLLSSWGALALLHHAIVSFSYSRLTGRLVVPPNKYLVLGDDIAISDPDLAKEYQAVCQEFSIVLSIPKSFIASTIVNFASRIITNKGIDISPISLKEVIQARNFDRKAEFAYRLQRRGFIPMGINNLFRAFFIRKSWKQEIPMLIKGTFSPFGAKSYRVLLQPNGYNGLTLINYILGLTPSMNLSTIPSINQSLTDHAISGYFTSSRLSAELSLSYNFVYSLQKYLDLKVKEWRDNLLAYQAKHEENLKLTAKMDSFFKKNVGSMFAASVKSNTPDPQGKVKKKKVKANPLMADFMAALSGMGKAIREAEPKSKEDLMKASLADIFGTPKTATSSANPPVSAKESFVGFTPFEAKVCINRGASTPVHMNTNNERFMSDINSLLAKQVADVISLDKSNIEKYITDYFKLVMKLPRIFNPHLEAEVWKAKKASSIKDQLINFGRFSLYERILARELLKGFLPKVPGITTGPYPFTKRRKRKVHSFLNKRKMSVQSPSKLRRKTR